jgi:hypothetical protein
MKLTSWSAVEDEDLPASLSERLHIVPHKSLFVGMS